MVEMIRILLRPQPTHISYNPARLILPFQGLGAQGSGAPTALGLLVPRNVLCQTTTIQVYKPFCSGVQTVRHERTEILSCLYPFSGCCP